MHQAALNSRPTELVMISAVFFPLCCTMTRLPSTKVIVFVSREMSNPIMNRMIKNCATTSDSVRTAEPERSIDGWSHVQGNCNVECRESKKAAKDKPMGVAHARGSSECSARLRQQTCCKTSQRHLGLGGRPARGGGGGGGGGAAETGPNSIMQGEEVRTGLTAKSLMTMMPLAARRCGMACNLNSSEADSL